MADFWQDISKFMFGDVKKKDQLQNNINGLQDNLNNIMDQLKNTKMDTAKYDALTKQRDELVGQLDTLNVQLQDALQTSRDKYTTNMANQMQDYMNNLQQQGVTTPSGTLKTGKEFAQEQNLIDKEYLAMAREQAKQREQAGLSTGLKLAKQSKLRGGQANIGQIMGQTEAIRRAGSEEILGKTKEETERGYQKGLAERGARLAFGSDINQMKRSDIGAGTQMERQDIGATDTAKRSTLATKIQFTQQDRQDVIDEYTRKLNALRLSGDITSSQLTAAQNQLNSMPDGFLQQIAEMGVGMGTRYLLSQINPFTALTKPNTQQEQTREQYLEQERQMNLAQFGNK